MNLSYVFVPKPNPKFVLVIQVDCLVIDEDFAFVSDVFEFINDGLVEVVMNDWSYQVEASVQD